MTSARRAGLAAIGALALVLTAAAAGHPVPARHRVASAPTAAAARPGPMLRVSLPHGLSRTARASATVTAKEFASSNWAGYAVSGGSKFSSVQATFFVPYVTCSKSAGQTLSSDWVGLDGFSNSSVEQGGIAADCSSAGKSSYYAWWETFPDPEVRTSVDIKPGDSVTAAISYKASDRDFRISLSDNTTGRHFAVTRTCPRVKIGKKFLVCPRTSAEVISEAPATGISAGKVVIARLTDYDAVSYGGISISDGAGHRGSLTSKRYWNLAEIVQVRASGVTVAVPTPVQGATFDDYWLREN
jgi:hypothetical protein